MKKQQQHTPNPSQPSHSTPGERRERSGRADSNVRTRAPPQLFDQKASSGQLADGASKESTIQKAGEMAMKMYFKSQGQQQGGLMAMASKFIK